MFTYVTSLSRLPWKRIWDGQPATIISEATRMLTVDFDRQALGSSDQAIAIIGKISFSLSISHGSGKYGWVRWYTMIYTCYSNGDFPSQTVEFPERNPCFWTLQTQPTRMGHMIWVARSQDRNHRSLVTFAAFQRIFHVLWWLNIHPGIYRMRLIGGFVLSWLASEFGTMIPDWLVVLGWVEIANKIQI